MTLTKRNMGLAAGLVVLCLCGLGIGGYRVLIAQGPAGGAQPRTDQDSLQGTWAITSYTIDGTSIPVEQLKGLEVKFAGNRILGHYFLPLNQYIGTDGKTTYPKSPPSITFTLDPLQALKAIRLTLHFDGWDETVQGAYHREGNSLTLRFGGATSTGQIAIELKRTGS